MKGEGKPHLHDQCSPFCLGALEKPGNLCQVVGDRCKCSDDFLQAYDICQIGLRMAVYPQKMDNNYIVSLFEALKIQFTTLTFEL